MKPYYYIYNAGNNPPSVKHETLKSAQDEAERLATKHPGKSFEILKCIGVSQTSNVSTFWMDGETGENEVKPKNTHPWKISISDSYCEYEYEMPISGRESVESVATKIAEAFKIEKPDGKQRN